MVRRRSGPYLLLNDSFLRRAHILNLLLELLLHLAHFLLHISHLLPLLLASLLEELGLGLDFWELWGLRLPSWVHLLYFAHVISLSHRLLFVCILLAIAWIVVLIACLLMVKIWMVVSSSTVVLMRIVHPCHLLLALAHLKLVFLLRLHDKLQHLELVFLHWSHMLHLLMMNTLVLVNHARVTIWMRFRLLFDNLCHNFLSWSGYL